MKCERCHDGGWVCENHEHKAWDGTSSHEDVCGCGAGMPCPDCNPLAKDNPWCYPDGGKMIEITA